MTFPIRKSARKLTGIVKITIPEVFPEMKPLGNVIIFPVLLAVVDTFDPQSILSQSSSLFKWLELMQWNYQAQNKGTSMSLCFTRSS